jgi:hypothetical protein
VHDVLIVNYFLSMYDGYVVIHLLRMYDGFILNYLLSMDVISIVHLFVKHKYYKLNISKKHI